MADTRFDWTLVRSFLAVLDAGSLMGAARVLRAQQPTLSRHVAELEAQLGAPLFERQRGGRDAAAGALEQRCAEPARQMAGGADALAMALAGQRELGVGSVRVTTSDVAAVWLLPRLLAELQQREPGIQLELVASNALSNLLRREADIAVRMVRPAQGSLLAKKLGEIAILPAAHASYLARAGTPRQPEDLPKHRLIGFDRDDGILRGFAAMGTPLTREHFALRTDDQVAYGRLVAAGAGIGFVADYQIPQWPGVRAVLPMLKIPPLPCWLAVHREIRGRPVVRRVYDFLAETIPAFLAESRSR
jgi:DNA-binding transcriptional LysR family regulator